MKYEIAVPLTPAQIMAGNGKLESSLRANQIVPVIVPVKGKGKQK